VSELSSQVPPQLVSVAVQAGRLLRGVPVIRTQVPAALHAMHWPVQAEVQQMPSAQKPDAHSVAAVHVRPASFFLMHTPVVSQYVPPAHELSVQLLEHFAVPSVAHRLLEHWLVVVVVQVPAPLQTEALVMVPLLQLAGEHTVVVVG
jgi:hypothetical protein